jgi:hypothetical protein
MLPSNGIALATLIMYGQSEKGFLKTGSGNFSKEVIGVEKADLDEFGAWRLAHGIAFRFTTFLPRSF